MATKVQKKELIRKQIIEAANIYSQKLAGKKFLYVTSNYYFEILFLTDKFLHLTGVNTKLTAKDFFEKDASKRIYTTLLVKEYGTSIPLNIKHLIDSSFYE